MNIGLFYNLDMIIIIMIIIIIIIIITTRTIIIITIVIIIIIIIIIIITTIITISNKFYFVKNGFKYFIGYKDDKKFKPLCTMLPKMFPEGFDEFKYMSLLINHLGCDAIAILKRLLGSFI